MMIDRLRIEAEIWIVEGVDQFEVLDGARALLNESKRGTRCPMVGVRWQSKVPHVAGAPEMAGV